VVDTTGSFDVLKLYAAIFARLHKDNAVAKTRDAAHAAAFGPDYAEPDGVRKFTNEDVEDAAERVLGRVRIMRVFDLEGVMEAVEEVGRELSGDVVAPDRTDTEDNAETSPTTTGSAAAAAAAANTPSLKTGEATVSKNVSLVVKDPPMRLEVPDSEDEEDEDEMLLDAAEQNSQKHTELQSGTENQDVVSKPQSIIDEPPEMVQKIEMIVIDNIAHVVSPVMKNNYVQCTSNHFPYAIPNILTKTDFPLQLRHFLPPSSAHSVH
jgi:hypothetical protein